MMSSFYSVLTHASKDVMHDTLVEEIQFNLNALLNARQYMLSTDSEYGLPDLCTEYTKDYDQAVIAATRALINQFEPRLNIKDISLQCNSSCHNQIEILVVAELVDNIVSFSAKIGSQLLSKVAVA